MTFGIVTTITISLADGQILAEGERLLVGAQIEHQAVLGEDDNVGLFLLRPLHRLLVDIQIELDILAPQSRIQVLHLLHMVEHRRPIASLQHRPFRWLARLLGDRHRHQGGHRGHRQQSNGQKIIFSLHSIVDGVGSPFDCKVSNVSRAKCHESYHSTDTQI